MINSSLLGQFISDAVKEKRNMTESLNLESTTTHTQNDKKKEDQLMRLNEYAA